MVRKKVKGLNRKEIGELAGLIWLIDVYGQTSTKDNLRRAQLEEGLSEIQADRLENYFDALDIMQSEGEDVEASERGIILALTGRTKRKSRKKIKRRRRR